MAGRIIFHIDVNSAFLSWEAVYRLKHLGGTEDLRKVPSVVGGDIAKRHGIILAKSIPAKKYGIHTGEPLVDALKKCPSLVVVPPNYQLYEKSSAAFMNILKKYSPAVEPFSIDEAFMDMTGTEKLFGDPVVLAHTIKDEIHHSLGFTVNIGVSCNKLLAKMAGDFKKPDLVHTLFPEEIKKKMWPLPVRDLFFVGRATERSLKGLGIRTIGELANTDPEILKARLKKHGEVIWKFANGIDTEIVEQEAHENKGYGNSTTISFDVTDAGTAKLVLLSLAETVAKRLRREHVKIEVISVGIRLFDLSWVSHQRKLESPSNITAQIHREACRLFDESWDGTPIRLLSIQTGGVTSENGSRQLSLFEEMDYEKMERVDKAIDSIRDRFGQDVIKRASFMNQDRIDHMSGGISRDKKTVDYSREKVK